MSKRKQQQHKTRPTAQQSRSSAAGAVTTTLDVPVSAMHLGHGCPVKFALADGGADGGDAAEGRETQIESRRFRMEPALAGHVPGHYWYGDLHIELSGVQMPRQVPALQEHSSDKRIGFTTALSIVKGVGLVAEGTMLDNPIADEIRKDAQAGYPWEASVHLQPLSIEQVGRGVTAKVNGADVVGPATIFRTSRLREVSFVTVGYDPETSATAFSGSAKVAVPLIGARSAGTMDEEETIEPGAAELTGAEAVAAERKRVAAILGAAGPQAEQQAIARKAIDDGSDVATAVLALNADLRARMESTRSANAGVERFEAGDTSAAASGGGNDAAVLAAKPAGADDAQWLKWSKDAKLRAEFMDRFDLFASYERVQAKGRVIKLDPAQAAKSIGV